MKNHPKSILFASLSSVFILFSASCSTHNPSLETDPKNPSFSPKKPQNYTEALRVQLPNPWTDCKNDLLKATDIAGLTFPLQLASYSARAMKNLIEIRYPLDEHRFLVVRKGKKTFDLADISGDYNSYPITEKLTWDRQTPITFRKDEKAIYVMFFETGSHVYSVNCLKGMTIKEAKDAYQVIREAENWP